MIKFLQKYQNSNPQKKQKINKIILYILIGSLIIIAIFTSSNPSLKATKNESSQGTNPYMSVLNLDEEISIDDKWLANKHDQIQELKSTSLSLKLENKQLKDKLNALSEKLDTYLQDDDSDYLRNEIEKLKTQRLKLEQQQKEIKLNKNKNDIKQNNYLNRNNDYQNYNNGSNPFSKNNSNNNQVYNNSNNKNIITTTPKASQIEITYLNPTNNLKKYDPKFYLPAGSYASAILISAVDASTSINAQSDPRQVLFRVVSKANSAKELNNNTQNKGNNNKKENVTINIEGCTVTGASYGDLSSERSYVRLLKMTCSRDGKIIETDVEGYASDGSDGKAGLAGKVISREGSLLAKSFIAGIVSGVGSGIAQKFNPTVSVADGYTNINTLSNKQVAGQGLSEGISKSSQNLSDYLIKRAEQYQPVISVASGKQVELVFISGVYLDGRIIKQQKSNNNNQQAGSSNNYQSNSSIKRN